MTLTGGSQDRLGGPQLRPPVDRRLQYWPVIHCESCGAVAIAALPSTQFCIECGTYVCAECWRDPDLRCSTCAASVPRPSKRLHVWTLRRADRRLREAIAELTEPDDDTQDGRDKRAQAIIKIESSLRGVEAALAHLPRAREQPRVAALLWRIERDSTAAVAALERQRVVTRPTPWLAVEAATRRSIAGVAPLLRLLRGPHDRRMGIAAGAAAAFLAALIGWSVIDPAFGEWGIAEGVLSGAPRDEEVESGAGSGSGSGPSPAETLAPAGDSLALFDFDALQMGSGIGAGWRDAGGGEVGLAAFPTGVDRSARLIADGATPARTCRTFDAGALAIQLDVFLHPRVPVAARVELTHPADGPGVAIDLSESRTVVSIAGEVAEGAGVQPGQWIHVDVRSEDGAAAWQISQGGNGSAPSAQGRSESRVLEELTEICLGAAASAGGTAHYDNVAIQWTSDEGG